MPREHLATPILAPLMRTSRVFPAWRLVALVFIGLLRRYQLVMPITDQICPAH